MLFPRFKRGLAQVRAGGAPKGIPQSALAAARRLDGLLCSCLLACWLAAGSGVGPPARAIRTGFPSSAIIVPFCCVRNALHVGRERTFLLVQQIVFVNHVVVVLQRNGHGSVSGAVLLFVLELHRRRENGLRSCRRLVRRQDAHSNSAGFCCCFFALRGALTARQQKGRVNGLQETVLVQLVVVVVILLHANDHAVAKGDRREVHGIGPNGGEFRRLDANRQRFDRGGAAADGRCQLGRRVLERRCGHAAVGPGSSSSAASQVDRQVRFGGKSHSVAQPVEGRQCWWVKNVRCNGGGTDSNANRERDLFYYTNGIWDHLSRGSEDH